MIILIVAIILIAVAVYIFVSRSKSAHQQIKEMFQNTDDKGGLLISMFGNADAQKILSKNSMEYADFDQCASVHRKTCAAFSLFRRDIWCCPFITPGLKMTIGVILRPDTFKPLLTGAFVIDANTNSRVACSNENGLDVDVNYGCIAKTFGKQGGVYINNDNDGSTSVSSKCADDDKDCRYLNSGAGINIFDMVNESQTCKCASISTSANKNYVSFDNCAFCDKLYLCSNEDIPTGGTNPSMKDNQITTYIGKKSENWTKMFVTDDVNIGYTSGAQCKFTTENLAGWKDALYEFYKLILTKDMPFNPLAPNYLENELNSYIYPDKTSDIYKRQNKVFIDSIVGFFYIGNTCEEQLTEGSSDSVQDCNVATKELDTSKRRTDELADLALAEKNAVTLAKLISATKGSKTAVYRAVLDSNNFPNKKSIRKAMAGQIEFDDLFSLKGEY